MYRRIQLLKSDYSKNYNNNFNLKMKSVSDEIFQTEKVFPAGYIPIGIYLKERLAYSANRDFEQHITSLANPDLIDASWDLLSEYEKIIASHLLYGFYNAYIFSGGMGSGKTSTANHVLEFIKNKFNTPNSAFIKISFDFNLGVVDEDDDGKEIIDRFVQELYNKLKVAIHIHIKNNSRDLVRDFWRYIDARNFEEYAEFFDLGEIVNDISWLDLSHTKKAETLIRFVETGTDRIGRIEMFMKFLGFLKTDLAENEFIIMFYDNIDILRPSLQKKLFHDYILPLNTISKTKCLISLRRTTFLRTFDFHDVRFAQSFGFIHHHGHKVSDIITQRLDYWKTNLDEHRFFKPLDLKYKEAFRKRITFLHNELSTKSNASSLAHYIDSLSGNCLRLGLYISHRLLINNIIKYDESPSQRDRYKKALIVNHESNVLLSDFEEVMNLFTVNNKFSLLPVRILNLVAESEAREGITINRIASTLSNYYSDQEINETIKLLLFSRRPLLWINRVDSAERLDPLASLFMTEIGTGYLHTLLEDLTYIQECFMATHWNSPFIPLSVDVQNEYERLSSVIKCLRVCFDEDFDSLAKLGPHNCSLITVRIIHRVTEVIVGLNLNTGLGKLFGDIQELLTYLLNIKKVPSPELHEVLVKVEHLSDNLS